MYASKITREELTSADSKQLGFDYQYMCFICQLLKMQYGEEVGYEYHDDIHTVSSKGSITYIQIKHTIEKSADGTQANLTDLSPDIWKTLSNWSKLVSDPLEHRDLQPAQLEFLKKSHFILWVNREINCASITALLSNAQAGTLTTGTARKELLTIKAMTKSKKLHEYIDDVLSLKGKTLLNFLSKVNIENSRTKIFDEIRILIQGKMVSDEYIDDIFANLYLQLKEDFFAKVESNQHQAITYSQWITHYLPIFTQYKNTLLPFREFTPQLPDHLENQFFVKELIEIGVLDFDDDGIAILSDITRCYICIEMQLNDWYSSGKISKCDRDRFHTEAYSIWKQSHQAHHRKTKRNASLDNDNALECYDALMAEKLQLLTTELGINLSNGEFIKLANECKIGWKYAWRERYKNAD